MNDIFYNLFITQHYLRYALSNLNNLYHLVFASTFLWLRLAIIKIYLEYEYIISAHIFEGWNYSSISDQAVSKLELCLFSGEIYIYVCIYIY